MKDVRAALGAGPPTGTVQVTVFIPGVDRDEHRIAKNSGVDRVAKALGAERVVALERLPSQGPLDLLELRAEVERRLRSTGGRPTDPDWDIRRLVPFRKEGWNELARLARSCERSGQRVSPSQLAALLIERGLESLKKSVGS
jgi:hypothetical protein